MTCYQGSYCICTYSLPVGCCQDHKTTAITKQQCSLHIIDNRKLPWAFLVYLGWHIEAETKWPPDDIFKRIFVNENVIISIAISLKFVPKGPINNIPALVQIMAWRRSGDKPLYEPILVRLLTHICVTRPQWVKMSKDCVVENGNTKYLIQFRSFYKSDNKSKIIEF